MAWPELPGDPWQYATWEGAERAQLLAGARMSLREKLAWVGRETPTEGRRRAERNAR